MKNHISGVPAALCDSLYSNYGLEEVEITGNNNKKRTTMRRKKFFDPTFKVKKNRTIENDDLNWKKNIFQWFKRLTVQERVVTCKTIDKGLTCMYSRLYNFQTLRYSQIIIIIVFFVYCILLCFTSIL